MIHTEPSTVCTSGPLLPNDSHICCQLYKHTHLVQFYKITTSGINRVLAFLRQPQAFGDGWSQQCKSPALPEAIQLPLGRYRPETLSLAVPLHWTHSCLGYPLLCLKQYSRVHRRQRACCILACSMLCTNTGSSSKLICKFKGVEIQYSTRTYSQCRCSFGGLLNFFQFRT